MKQWDRWATGAGLVLTFIGLIFAAHTIQQSSDQMAANTANDLRTHLVDAARRITEANGGDIVSFEFDNMLHLVNAHIADMQAFNLDLLNESFLESTVTTLMQASCPSHNDQPVADHPKVMQYETLTKWARARQLQVKCFESVALGSLAPT